MQEQTKQIMERERKKAEAKKATPEKKIKGARSIKSGDIVKVPGQGEQVVRDVMITIRLANGWDHVVESEKELETFLYPDPEVEE